MSLGSGHRRYVSVGQRLSQARSYAADVAKEAGRQPQPVQPDGAKITSTFWGKAWCSHLESYSDYSNGLPHGRIPVRNGSVVDLEITAGRVEAIVAGSDVCEVEIVIERLADSHWRLIRDDCAASIDSLLDLLGGRFSKGVMSRLTDRNDGLFPSPREISLSCSCSNSTELCEHLAAVLYGVGTRLDERPELLFLLRDVDHAELVNEAVSNKPGEASNTKKKLASKRAASDTSSAKKKAASKE
jgi:uncharacterized Zn finger protein